MRSLLGFEVSVLRRLEGESIAIAFGGEGKLAWHLKLLGKRVMSNDLCQATTWQAIGSVENNGFLLSASACELLVEAANTYQEQHELRNQKLLDWFPLAQACWLEGYRDAVLKLGDRPIQGLAFTLGLRLGEYWLSFERETESLRRSWDDVIPEVLMQLQAVIDNRRENLVLNLDAHQFALQVKANVFYAHLPSGKSLLTHLHQKWGWQEIWLSGDPQIWERMALAQRGRFGGQLQTRSAYKETTRSLCKRLRAFPQWAIGVTQPGPLSLDETIHIIEEFRRVDKIYTKDVGEFLDGNAQQIIVTKPL
ncbi:MAG: hypothetical protein K1Y36_13230 [Blastocatellia bacterium]|nr:hypothetical protein [Blastocatellia bacterium]